MQIIHQTAAAVAVATTAALNLLGTPAVAFTVTQNGANLLNELLGPTPGLSNFTLTTTGDARAFGFFNDDPFGLGSGIVLSTGQVVDLPGVNTLDAFDGLNLSTTDLSTDFDPAGSPGDPAAAIGDSITLNIAFDADDTVEKLFFNYVFGSEEFLEYAGSAFNDSFELMLNGVNLAFLSNGDLVTVNNLASSPVGPFSPDFINNPAGLGTQTKLDGFTKVLSFEGPINKNTQNILSINIRDVGDGALDSAVFIQGGSITTVTPTPVPEPGTIGGLLLLGFGWLLKKQKA